MYYAAGGRLRDTCGCVGERGHHECRVWRIRACSHGFANAADAFGWPAKPLLCARCWCQAYRSCWSPPCVKLSTRRVPTKCVRCGARHRERYAGQFVSQQARVQHLVIAVTFCVWCLLAWAGPAMLVAGVAPPPFAWCPGAFSARWLPAPCWASRWARLGSCCSNNRFRAGFGNATARVLAASDCPRRRGCWLLRSCWIACGVAGSLNGGVSGLRYCPLAVLVKRLANTRKPAQWGVERAFPWLPKAKLAQPRKHAEHASAAIRLRAC